MWQMLSSTPGDKEGKEMKKSFTTSQVKMITRTLIIVKSIQSNQENDEQIHTI